MWLGLQTVPAIERSYIQSAIYREPPLQLLFWGIWGFRVLLTRHTRTGHGAAPLKSSIQCHYYIYITHKGVAECKFPSCVEGDLLGAVIDSVQPHFALEAACGNQLTIG